MKGGKSENNNQGLQKNSKIFAELLLCSLKTSKSQISKVQQINQFLTYLSRQEKVFLTPVYKRIVKQRQKERLEYEYIQIYNIRDNQTRFKRRCTRKRLTKNDQASHQNNESVSNDKSNGCRVDKLMFLIEESLCLNSILYSMAKSQKIHLSFGTKREDLQVIVLQTLNQIPNIDQSILKPIIILPQLKQIFAKNSQKMSENAYVFCSLKSLVIEVHSQSLTFQQWITSMKIIGQLVTLIQNSQMVSLQKLQINIYDDKKYYQNSEAPFIDNLIAVIFRGLSKIIKSKGSQSSNPSIKQYCFPKLTQMSFNPTLLQRVLSKSKQDIQKNEEDAIKVNMNKPLPSPITKLILIQLPPAINKKSQFFGFVSQIFSQFPKLIHLTIEMSRSYAENQFKLFNQLCQILHKFCPFLQFLSVMNNDQKLDKQVGLRYILEFYPFLSDLKIKMSPSHITSKAQCQNEWIYMNEILWRRLHVQRLINLVRILEQKGYQRYDCMGVMEFMKPLKFPMRFPINNGQDKK